MFTTLIACLMIPAKPFLSPVFGEHMVLQRDRPNSIWGWTTPGETVTVDLGDKHASAKAGADGKWMAKLDMPRAGGPYTMLVSGPASLEFHDILVGDVWLCSGQSNMEMGVNMSKDPEATIAAADKPEIRLLLTDHQYGYEPTNLIKGRWKPCNPTTIKEGGWNGFSAVAYHFGSKLNRDLGVPVGLIQAAWGGSAAECWVLPENLRPLKDFNDDLDMISSRKVAGKPQNPFYFSNWLETTDPGSDPSAGWERPDFDDSNWAELSLPLMTSGQGFSKGKGVTWLRNHFQVNRAQADPCQLHFGRVVGMEVVWINGHKIVDWGGDWDRWYEIPTGVLKEGDNTIAIRHIGLNKDDGFYGMTPQVIKEGQITMATLPATWKMMKGVDIGASKTQPKNWDAYPSMPTVLRYGMIAPLMPMTIRGAIWYQGETNAGRGRQYQSLLPALINDWRRGFDNPKMPFYIVSLANYQRHRSEPGDDGWAELREAQAMTAEKIGHSGLAVTVDVGNAYDIHPKDKLTVGERLASVALVDEFKKKVPFAGPTFAKIAHEGSNVIVTFKHTDGGLVIKGKSDEAFQVAGEDRKWFWAKPELVGDTIVLSCDSVIRPVAVRYAWQSNPQAPLYNKAGFPAVPFRTDAWWPK